MRVDLETSAVNTMFTLNDTWTTLMASSLDPHTGHYYVLLGNTTVVSTGPPPQCIYVIDSKTGHLVKQINVTTLLLSSGVQTLTGLQHFDLDPESGRLVSVPLCDSPLGRCVVTVDLSSQQAVALERHTNVVIQIGTGTALHAGS